VINLGGFVQTADQWKVLLAVTTKSGNTATPEYLTMAEGDKEGVVELLKIYPLEDKVDINNSGTPMTLTMKDNGFASAPAAPPAGGRGGSPAIRQIGTQPNMVVPGVQAPPQPPQAMNGEYNNGSALLVGSRGPINSPAVFTGNGVQAQQASYQQGGGIRSGEGVLSAGGATFAPPAQALPPITIGQRGDLSHLTQANSTPPNTQALNVEMPPIPGQQ
jgi:hypothetical protein